MKDGNSLENTCQDGQSDQAGDHAGAVDGKAAEPFLQVVARGVKDEEFVAKERVGDADGGRKNAGEVDRERQIPVRQDLAEKVNEKDIKAVPEDGVPHPDEEVAKELAGREKAADTADQAGPGVTFADTGIMFGGGGEGSAPSLMTRKLCVPGEIRRAGGGGREALRRFDRGLLVGESGRRRRGGCACRGR